LASSASSKNQTPHRRHQIRSSRLLLTGTDNDLVDDQPEPQPPLFSSPSTNSILVEQRKEDEEKIVSHWHKLKSPNDNNGTTPAISTTPSKVAASVLTHIN
jgi:hypothetical protein